MKNNSSNKLTKEVILNARLLLLNPNGIKLMIEKDLPISFKVSKEKGFLMVKMVVD